MIKMNAKILILALAFCAAVVISPSPVFCKANHDELLMEQIRQYISDNIQRPTDDVQITFLSRMPKTDDLTGNITFSIDSSPRQELIGDMSCDVRIFSNGIFAKRASVRVRIEVLQEFVVSRGSIARGNILTENDIAIQKNWVRRIPTNNIFSLEDAVGKSIIVNLSPNTQITTSMLKEVFPVKKGKLVQVILNNGAMTMMMNAKAEEDGAEDSLVKVRNLNSNKIIYARVIGEGKVQVDF